MLLEDGDAKAVMAGALVLGVYTSEMPPVAVAIVAGDVVLYSSILLYETNAGKGGYHTTTEQPWTPTDGFENSFDNREYYYRPGTNPPKWFWPFVGGAAAYELYKNWPKPEPLPADKTKVVQPMINK
ncbi:MAG: hypothetical protein WHT29_01030 [Bacteroidales bacterium]